MSQHSTFQHNELLQARQSGDRIPVGTTFSTPVQTGPALHPPIQWTPGHSRL